MIDSTIDIESPYKFMFQALKETGVALHIDERYEPIDCFLNF